MDDEVPTKVENATAEMSELDKGLADLLKENLKAKPAFGWMSIRPIPGSKIIREEKPMEIPPQLQALIPGFQLVPAPVEVNDENKPGIIAAELIEIGPMPGGQMEFPYQPGDTLYLGSDRGIDIGRYRFVMVDKVICFDPKNRDED